MELSEEAQRYYQQTCGVKLGDIERWFQPALNQVEMEMASRGMSRSGIRNKAIEDVVIERWQKLVQARIESFLDAYEVFEIRLEEDDVKRFVETLDAARPNIMESVSS